MLLNIDWLQIHCKGQIEATKKLKFVFKHATKQFQTVGVLIYQKEEVASVSMHPHTELSNGGMSADTILLKFKNKFLYQSPERLKIWIETILAEMPAVKVVGLSRIDLALDFNTFKDGYEPATMIKDFCAERILKNSRGQFRTDGTHNRQINYHYLRFGNHTSERSIYLYNKSKEMREREHKKHIENSWHRCSEINVLNDVWRLELSMKGNKHRLHVDTYMEPVTSEDISAKKYVFKKEVSRPVKPTAGQIKKANAAGSPLKLQYKIDLCDLEVQEGQRALKQYNEERKVPEGFVLFRVVRFEDLLDAKFLKNLYFTCIYQNFIFVHNDKQQNKTRMKKVVLFDEVCEFNKIQSLPENKDATRSNRIFIKHLHNHIQDLKGMNEVLIEQTTGREVNLFSPEELKEAIETVQQVQQILQGGEQLMANYSNLYDLTKYLKRIKQLYTSE